MSEFGNDAVSMLDWLFVKKSLDNHFSQAAFSFKHVQHLNLNLFISYLSDLYFSLLNAVFPFLNKGSFSAASLHYGLPRYPKELKCGKDNDESLKRKL